MTIVFVITARMTIKSGRVSRSKQTGLKESGGLIVGAALTFPCLMEVANQASNNHEDDNDDVNDDDNEDDNDDDNELDNDDDHHDIFEFIAYPGQCNPNSETEFCCSKVPFFTDHQHQWLFLGQFSFFFLFFSHFLLRSSASVVFFFGQFSFFL